MEGTLPQSEPASLRPGVRRVLDLIFFGFLPLVPLLTVAEQAIVRRKYIADGWFFDMHWLWVGWTHVAHGQNPYVDFLYPAPAAVLPAPLGFLGYWPAAIIWLLILVASIVLALRVLGVRDWRCYSLALFSLPAYASFRIGTPTPVLMLAAACAWRYRDRRWVVSLAVAFAIGFKIFLWPLLIWLAVTRFRTAMRALIVTVGLVLGCWAIIGFAGVQSYGQRLNGTESIDAYRGYSVIALAHEVGLGSHGSRAVAALVALAALTVIVLLGRRRGRDRDSFIAAIAASLLAAPVVWGHYFLLALVPLALARKHLSLAWLVPTAFWLIPQQENRGSIVTLILGLGIFLGLLAWSARDPDRPTLLPSRPAEAGLP